MSVLCTRIGQKDKITKILRKLFAHHPLFESFICLSNVRQIASLHSDKER